MTAMDSKAAKAQLRDNLREVSAELEATEEAYSLKPDVSDPDTLPALTPEIDAEAAKSTAADSDTYQEPWNRLVGEGPVPWKYFKFYRDLGPTRTRKAVYTEFDLHPNSIKRYYDLYDWEDRVLAFDRYEDRQYQIRRDIAVREMADRHGAQIVQALEALSIPLMALSERYQENPEKVIKELKGSKLKDLLTLGARSARLFPNLMSAERLSRGMPTEITQEKVEVNVRYQIDRDGIAEVAEVLARAGAFDERSPALRAGEVVDVDPGLEVHPEDGSDVRADT